MELAGKTIIVTGASSGIGAAAARLFAREGARLVLGARRKALLDEIARQIRDEGGHAEAVEGDVRDETFARDLVRVAKTMFGGLDAAFNNAGIVGPLAPVQDLTVDDWREVLETNLTGAFLAARHQIPALRERGGGSIVFTSSFVGHTIGLPGMSAYAAAKAGLVGLTQVMASENGAAAIRVNALLPGGTRTPMAGDDRDTLDFVRGLHALKRMAEPEEIANAALFLMSDRSSFVTGAAMIADGGNSICKT
ncbi:MAG: SDR family oxidoreductase [Paracoccaceae bacterium]